MSPEPSASATVIVIEQGGADELLRVLLPLIAAFWGAVVGGFVTYRVQKRLARGQAEQTGRGAARLIFFELLGNVAMVEAAAESGILQSRFATAAWQSRMADVGAWLSPAALYQVQGTYAAMARLQDDVWEVAQRPDAESPEMREAWRLLADKLGERVIPCLHILVDAFSPGEQAELMKVMSEREAARRANAEVRDWAPPA